MSKINSGAFNSKQLIRARHKFAVKKEYVRVGT